MNDQHKLLTMRKAELLKTLGAIYRHDTIDSETHKKGEDRKVLLKNLFVKINNIKITSRN